MILFVHIIIAVLSLIFTTIAYLSPDTKRLTLSYLFMGLTLGSGTMLVFLKPDALAHTCIMGIVYLIAMTSAMVLTHRKLAKIH